MGEFSFQITLNRQECDLVLTSLKVTLGILHKLGKQQDAKAMTMLLARFKKVDH